MRYSVLIGLLLLLLIGSAMASADWPHYGGGPDQTRYSPLTQITPENVHRLEVAWTYDTGDAFPGSEMQCQPVVAHGVLYAASPKLRVFALDAATGALQWSFDPLPDSPPSRTRIRGLMYWERGEERRIYFAARHWLYALDARTGRPIASFGQGGRIDLREGFKGRDPRTLSVGLNTPGVFYGDLLIIGSVVPEGLPSAPGDIRAFDVHTGERKWAFHTIPHPGEFGYETWPKDAWKYAGGANAWAGLALDERRGLVYAATGSAAYDFYGGNRHGDNLFANTILCLRAATGERVWHFQAVKHDIWDRDFPAPPTLVTIERNGRRIDAVAQIAKNGRTYVLDRETGEPLFPMEEIEAPASDVPGEWTAPKQVLPKLPPPFTRQRFTEDMITRRTPEAFRAVRERWLQLRRRGEYEPPSLQGSILFPGMDGGAEWGGAAYDPKSGLLFVNANEMAWIVKLAERKLPDGEPETSRTLYERHCAACHRSDFSGQPPEFPSLKGIAARRDFEQIVEATRNGGGRMPSFRHLDPAVIRALVHYIVTGESVNVGAGVRTPYDVPYTLDGDVRFTDPDGFPAITPPWGTLTAIDLNKGEIAWQVPLGEMPGSGLENTGSENYGGPVVTASGLIFIGATNYDNKFRAFEAATGRKLWEASLPAAGNATPAVYEVNGRQFVVIAAGGGKWGAPSGGTYVAFALRKQRVSRVPTGSDAF
ncbi:MAG TPA: PQQ-binding-like beta-propeller repeat protein [Vicinamibacterales bacterium]|nr:PQQ-binding-like beta-propeller repeat protein [Vicinamibacterales bacterium]